MSGGNATLWCNWRIRKVQRKMWPAMQMKINGDYLVKKQNKTGYAMPSTLFSKQWGRIKDIYRDMT